MTTSVYVQISLEIWGAIFCLLCSAVVFFDRSIDRVGYKIQTAALLTQVLQLVNDTCALVFRGHDNILSFYLVRISNICVFLANFLLACIFATYISHLVRSHGGAVHRLWLYAISFFGIMGAVNVLLSLFTKHLFYFDADNFYHRGQFFWIIAFFVGVQLLLLAGMLIAHRKSIGIQNFVALMCYTVLLIIAASIQNRIYGIPLSNLTNTISVLLVFVVYQANRAQRILEQDKLLTKQRLHLAEQESELAKTRMNLMVSQIQPHFISNTLLTIQGLYHENLENADPVMNSFIHYLQQNFSGLSAKQPIPIEEEIDYTQNYSNIAITRWPDMTVEYQLDCTGFFIPAMTIQPLVENAIRHGLMPLESGGKVLVRTYESPDDYFVCVEDNGAGFDPNDPASQSRDNRIHIGLSNIQSRLQIMSDGDLTIRSAPGQGTTVTIRIPKKGENP